MPTTATMQPDSPAGSSPLSAEQRLLAAIIERAVDDLDKAARREEAQRWLLSDSGRPLGLVWICNLLDINPETVRRLAGLS